MSPNWYHMKYIFLIFISLFLPFGGFAKYGVPFFMETQVIELLLTNKRKLGDHHSARFSDHLNCNRHKLSIKKQFFKEMSNRSDNIWQMAFNASLQSGETKPQNNRFILKCFFKIRFLMIRKNWAHSHNFTDVVEPVVDC